MQKEKTVQIHAGTGSGSSAEDTPPHFTGLQLTLMTAERILENSWIPAASAETVYLTSHLFAEKYQNTWYAACRAPSYLLLAGQSMGNVAELTHRSLYACVDGDTQMILYTEYLDETSALCHNYHVSGEVSLKIGRTRENDILYENHSVSRSHAILHFRNGRWSIEDPGSTNGVYVNGRRIQRCQLSLGDCVFLVGLRIIIGTDFISLNDGNDRISILTDRLSIGGSGIQRGSGTDAETGTEETFSRVPRKRTGPEKKTIEIEGPPMSLSGKGLPLILSMGSSMLMSGASALTGNFLPLVSTMLFPTLSHQYSEKEKKEYEARRQEKYGDYLKQKGQELQEQKRLEEEFLRAEHPDADTVLAYANRSRHLWERRPGDADYLELRLGTGVLPMQAELRYPKQRFSLEEDALETKMRELAEEKRCLLDVPITVSLREHTVIGMKGEGKRLREMMTNLLIQLAVFHSYDEVKLLLLTDPQTLSEIPWVNVLPHVWNDQKNQRLIATNPAEAYQIGEYFRNQIGGQIDQIRMEEGNPKGRPWYVVLATSRQLTDSLEFLTELMQSKKNCGVSVVAAYDMPPKDSSVLLDLSYPPTGKLLYLDRAEREDAEFTPDFFPPEAAAQRMRLLGNTFLRDNRAEFQLPQSLSFLELFHVGNIEQLQVLKRWRESDPVHSLAVPVGIGANGTTVELDLHEKYHGPHGLVAGTTGSGKSEFLLTYILSLALHFSPEEVAFVLIDYKGGGLAGAFVDEKRQIFLPHVVGTITNLDGAAISRSLISIQSELIRRQEVFNRARTEAEVGTMDIYAYQRLYRRGVVKQPMPHLMIISDEFAELKAQQPEFMDQLISIARIGRSLGIHLILATQKPAGIVNDQIRSNAKFKVCLKVQDRSDSMDMLRRPDAIEIKETGRFYLQVGYNESFLLGQSAWSGAPYIEREQAEIHQNKTVRFIDQTGQVYHTGKLKSKQEARQSQLAAMVKLISDTAKAAGFVRNMLWKPMLPGKIPLELSLSRPNPDPDPGIRLENGFVDQPTRQRQMGYSLNLSGCKNLLLLGETGSGKTTWLQSALLQLTCSYTPEELQYYIFDYSGGRYAAFDRMPHCGAVISEEAEAQIPKCFRLLDALAKERKALFQRLEAENYAAASRIQKIPLVLVVLDDITGFAASGSGADVYGKLNDYMKRYAACGIVFLLAVSHLNELLTRVRAEIGTKIVFHQKSRFEYSDALEARCGYEPPELPGRGLVLFEGEPMEYQAAMFEPGLVGKERNDRIRSVLKQRAEELKDTAGAKRLPVIPENQAYADFADRFRKGRIPLGYSLADAKPVALPLKQIGMLSVYFGNPLGRHVLIENLFRAVQKENMEFFVVKKQKNSVFDTATRNHVSEELMRCARCYAPTEEALKRLKTDLEETLKERRPVIEEIARKEGLRLALPEDRNRLYAGLYEVCRPVLVFLESFPETCRAADEVTANIFGAVYLKHANRFLLSFVGGFEPEEKEDYLDTVLCRTFRPWEQALLFGGRLNGQAFLDVSELDRRFHQVLPYPKAVMRYQDRFYSLQMPCGELIREEIDEDEQSIF